MTNVISNIMAVPDAAKAEAGAVVFWSLHDGSLYDDVATAWAADGHDPKYLPLEITPLAALKRAMKSLASFRIMVRPLGAGFALVDEEANGDALDYTQRVTVKVDKKTGALTIDPPTFNRAKTLREEYDLQLRSIHATRIGAWLMDLARSCHAVSLRTTGGFYWIPGNHLQRFRAWADTIMRATNAQIFEIPAMESSQAVAAILDALQREADAEMTDIDDEVDAGKLGVDALEGRKGRINAMRKKLESYADLLGENLDAIEERLGGTEAAVVEAIFQTNEAKKNEAEKKAATNG